MGIPAGSALQVLVPAIQCWQSWHCGTTISAGWWNLSSMACHLVPQYHQTLQNLANLAAFECPLLVT